MAPHATALTAGQLAEATVGKLPLNGGEPLSDAYSTLFQEQHGWLLAIDDALGLKRVAEYDGLAASGIANVVQGFEDASGRLDWLTAASSILPFGSARGHVRIAAWVGPSCDVPHLVLEAVPEGEGVMFIRASLLPRRDLVADGGDYLRRYWYSTPPSQGQRPLRSFHDLWLSCAQRKGWAWEPSNASIHRSAVGGGLAMMFHLPSPDQWSALTALREALDIWLAFLLRAGAESAVPEGPEREALAARDRAHRDMAVFGDPHFNEGFLGAEAHERMGSLLAKRLG